MPTWKRTWNNMGFFNVEAEQFKKIGRDGMRAPYIQAMIADRQALLQQAEQEGWSKREYRKRVAQDYADKGVMKRAFYKFGWFGRQITDIVWGYFKWYQDNRMPPDSDWISPQKKRRPIKQTSRKKQLSRTQKLQARIDDYNDRIRVAISKGNTKEFHRLEGQRNRIQVKLDTIKGIRD